MIEKYKILESWIMVEHLSEGDIGLNDKAILTLNDLQEQDFYSLFLHEIEKKKWNQRQKGGVVVYFDIFKFQEVVDILRAEYGLESTDEDFDETARDSAKFNAAMQNELLRHEVDIINCRMKILGNIETEATNLHSFFIDDLEKAKKIEMVNLNAYLYGNKKECMNLDSKKDSVNFHPHLFEQILQPKNYPLGRFPSNTTYALSLMQQVAVLSVIGNCILGLNVMSRQIRIGLSENIKISIWILWMIMHTRMSCACRSTRRGHSLLMRILDALQERLNMLEREQKVFMPM